MFDSRIQLVSSNLYNLCVHEIVHDLISIVICINCAEITKDGIISIDICINCAEITKDGVINIAIYTNCAVITKDDVMSIDTCINCRNHKRWCYQYRYMH